MPGPAQTVDVTDAQTWSLLGIVSAMVAGAFGVFGFAFQSLRAEMQARFDAVDVRFDGVDTRFDGVDRRLDALDRDVQTLFRDRY